MTRRKPNVLIISPEHWTALPVSKHHYARTLCEKGCNVLFLNPPDYSIESITITPVTELPGLFVVDSSPVLRGLRYLPQLIRQNLEASWLNKLEHQFGDHIDVVWLFENSRFYNMEFAGSRLRIYHQVDIDQNFHANTAASSADICLCTSDAIARRLQPFARHLQKIDHGYATSETRRRLPEILKRHFDHPGPHATYIGNLNRSYIHVDLLYKAALLHPNCKFHLIGNFSTETPIFQKAVNVPNITWWGRLDSDLIPEALSQSDVLLLTYDSENWLEEVSNPHKVMQYMGSGKVTVATWTEEYADKHHLMQMVRDPAEFLPCLTSVLSNLGTLNAPEKMAQRISFAEANSYSNQLDKIFQAFDKLGIKF